MHEHNRARSADRGLITAEAVKTYCACQGARVSGPPYFFCGDGGGGGGVVRTVLAAGGWKLLVGVAITPETVPVLALGGSACRILFTVFVALFRFAFSALAGAVTTASPANKSAKSILLIPSAPGRFIGDRRTLPNLQR